MNTKLIHIGIGLLAAGTIGIIFAVVMELATAEPVYYIVMKITAGVFGIGGPLLGIGIAKSRGKKRGGKK